MRLFVIAMLIAVMPIAMCSAEERDVFDDWFGMLEFQAGSLWSFEREEFTPFVSAPFIGYKDIRGVIGAELDLDDDTEEEGPVAGLLGVTYNLGNLKEFGVDVPWAQHFGLNVGLHVRYDFDTKDKEVGVMLSVIDLSFSGGGVKEQKQR